MSCRMAEAIALASSANSPVFRPQLCIKPCKSLRYQGPSSLFPLAGNRELSVRCSLNIPNEKPFVKLGKVKILVERYARELWETFPEPVKEFPWKKAEEVLLQRLFFLGQRALKWVLIILFVASSLSDVIFAISRNQELVIPIGLFLGCLMADFLKETSQEMFLITQEEGLSRHFIGIGLFFVIIKFISLYLGIQGRVFLSQLGNGGLMQAWWLAKQLAEGTTTGDQSEESSPPDTKSEI